MEGRLLLLEAVPCLLVARLAAAFVPFPVLARSFGAFASPLAEEQDPATPEEQRLAVKIGWAVTRSARYLPFRAVCLPQAITAHAMLRRRHIRSVMHFGAAKAEDASIEFHAWLDAAGVQVTGYPIATKFTEIACFV